MNSYDHVFKILTIGDSAVGKTCLVLRFTENKYSTDFMSTVGIDFKIKICKIKGKTVKLQVWDTSGQERFKTITNKYYKSGDGILLVYDVTNLNSFLSLKDWMKQIELNAKENIQKILVGNKSDMLNRKVSYEEGEAVAKYFGIPFFETSAKENLNVNEMFRNITLRITDQTETSDKAKSGKLLKDKANEIQRKMIMKDDQGCKNCNC